MATTKKKAVKKKTVTKKTTKKKVVKKTAVKKKSTKKKVTKKSKSSIDLTNFENDNPPQTKSKHNAVFAFLFSLVSFLPLFNYFIAPISIFISLRAINQIKNKPGQFYGVRYAKAALIISILVTFAPFTVSAAIASITALDFLGYGLPAPTPSWGELLRQGVDNLRTAPWIVISTVTALVGTLTLVAFVGEAVRESWEPLAGQYQEFVKTVQNGKAA